jgi:hypothetical protein
VPLSVRLPQPRPQASRWCRPAAGSHRHHVNSDRDSSNMRTPSEPLAQGWSLLCWPCYAAPGLRGRRQAVHMGWGSLRQPPLCPVC